MLVIIEFRPVTGITLLILTVPLIYGPVVNPTLSKFLKLNVFGLDITDFILLTNETLFTVLLSAIMAVLLFGVVNLATIFGLNTIPSSAFGLRTTSICLVNRFAVLLSEIVEILSYGILNVLILPTFPRVIPLVILRGTRRKTSICLVN